MYDLYDSDSDYSDTDPSMILSCEVCNFRDGKDEHFVELDNFDNGQIDNTTICLNVVFILISFFLCFVDTVFLIT